MPLWLGRRARRYGNPRPFIGRKRAVMYYLSRLLNGAPIMSSISHGDLSRSAAIARKFGARALVYDEHADLQRGVATRLATTLPALVAPRVLELGCGTGLFSRELIARYPDGDFVLSDLSPDL